MSKWKLAGVQIVQIVATDRSGYPPIMGLGDDQKIYCWDRRVGAWEKYWVDKDVPS